VADSRLDAALAQRGLARSRTHAAKLVSDGLVTVDGRPVVKASAPVRENQTIEVAGSDHYVSRAAHKLIAGLDAFPVRVDGTLALDVGASTGGFSQVLLERGARRVIALDVGHDQLVDEVRSDERVTVVEGFNARDMTAGGLAAVTGIDEVPTLVVGDLSFISLRMVLPALVATVGTSAEFVLLVKPQFEVGRTGIREGIVKSAGLRADAVTGVMWAGHDLGLRTAGVIPSPIAGGSGNQEYLLWLSTTAGSNPTEWLDKVSALA
jgi:23S rRNA (cytidine1920-2'-O)/16S rRNA (cytidine1409-2'-O)-methyltransferase